MYYQRTLKYRWQEISEQFPVLMLTGPRQVGKTTFLKHIAEKERKYVSFDDPDARLLASEDPAMFFRRYSPPVLIDEIQYAPNIMTYIKMQVDQNRKPGMFWLTGSQQFRMMKGISETLAGRVAIMNILGLSGEESRRIHVETPAFLPTLEQLEKRQSITTGPTNTYQDIWKGSFPALVSGEIRDWEIFYSSYLRTYLERDVRDLTQVGDEGAFLKFLKACAARTGQMLNLSELARDTDITVKTARSWLSILEASFQVYLLEPYHTNLTKRLVKRPKLYFLDTGLCSYLCQWTSADALEAGAMSGAILETYVFTEILKSWWHRGKTPSIYYYRDKDQVEIDFVLIQNEKFYPLEVKKSASPKKDWIKNIKKLQGLGDIEAGGVICLSKNLLPIGSELYTIPVHLI
jgi:predicted AAA+ superfamily ATPase